MHTVNGDPMSPIAAIHHRALWAIEQISGQSCGVHITGGLMLAGTRERLTG
jgi:dimethylglycine dehydrogenase